MPLDLKAFFLEGGSHTNFFQAAWLLERLYARRGRSGTGDDLRTEAVRFETLNTLGFPPSDIAAILPPLSLQGQADAATSGKEAPPVDLAALPPLESLPDLGRGPLRMIVTFMGLYGVSSPLPAYFVDPITLRKTEYFELRKFLDIFSHRIYSLFFRSWKKYRHYAQFRPDPPDDYTLRLLALTGQWPRRSARPVSAGAGGRPVPGRDGGAGSAAPDSGSSGAPRDALRGSGGFPPGPSGGGAPWTGAGPGAGFDLRRIPFARLLGNRVRSAKGLQQLLRGYFGFPRVRVVQFASAWVDIPVPTRLGSGETLLGRSVRLGHRMEDLLSRFIVEIGPLARAGFERFLPAEDALLAPFRTVRAGRDGHDRQEGRDGAEPVPALVDRVRDLVDAYLRDPLHYEVKVLLDPGRTPPAVLGSPDARLGMGLWLGTRPAGEIACRL